MATSPVNRNNMFYSEQDFQLETDIWVNYIEEDLNQTIVLYAVDHSQTTVNSIYNTTTSSDIRFKTPKELPCMYEIKEPETKSYDSTTQNAVYQIGGNLEIIMPTKVLEKYDADITRGDYIGILVDDDRMVYYVVTNDGKVNTNNSAMLGGYRPAARKIEGTMVTDTEFKGV